MKRWLSGILTVMLIVTFWYSPVFAENSELQYTADTYGQEADELGVILKRQDGTEITIEKGQTINLYEEVTIQAVVNDDTEEMSGYQYQFSLWDQQQNTYVVCQGFSGENQYKWSTDEEGMYLFLVECRNESGNIQQREFEIDVPESTETIDDEAVAYSGIESQGSMSGQSDIAEPFSEGNSIRRADLVINNFSVGDSSIIYRGESVNLSVNVSGGQAPYKYCFYVVRGNSKIMLQDFSEKNTYQWTPYTPAEYKVYAVVQDSSGNEVTEAVSRTVSEPYVDITVFKVGDGSGSSPAWKTFTLSTEVEAHGATGELEFRYYVVRAESIVVLRDYSTSNTCTWRPYTAAEYRVYVNVKDANGVIYTESLDYKVEEAAALSIQDFTVLPESQIVRNNTVSITAQAEGGTGEYEYCFYLVRNSSKIVLKDFTSDNSVLWTPYTAADYKVHVEVRDSAGNQVKDEKEFVVRMSNLTIDEMSVTPGDGAAAGSTVTIEALASEGEGRYEYCFYVIRDGSKILLQDFSSKNVCNWNPVTPANYDVIVEVRDETGETVTRSTEYVIFPNEVKITRFNIDSSGDICQGNNIVLTVEASGGSLPYEYQFYVMRNGEKIMLKDFSEESQYTWVPYTPAEYEIYAVVRDKSGREVVAKKIAIVQPAEIKINSFTVGNGSYSQANQKVHISTEVEQNPYLGELQYKYYVIRNGSVIILKDFSSESSVDWTPYTPADYDVVVEVKSSSGQIATAYHDFTVITQTVFVDSFSKSCGDNVFSNTAVTLKASGHSESGEVEYSFYVIRNNEKILLQDFSEKNEYVWTPYTPASYDVYVEVRNEEGISAVSSLTLNVIEKHQLLGIDVSSWQGDIDWTKVKNDGIDFAMIRAVSGTMSSLKVDDQFYSNIQGAAENGIMVGVYRYGYAVTEEEAVREAEMVVDALKKSGVNPDFPVAYDVEDASTQGQLSKEQLTKVIKAFQSVIEDNGYKFMIYANKSWLETKIDMEEFATEDVWIARYRDYTPDLGHGYTGPGNVTIWQYSDRGQVSGIAGNVDMNIGYHLY